MVKNMTPKSSNSEKLWAEAQKYLPGGVNSPVRAFGAVGGTPVFVERGSGSKIYDADGNEYIDYVCSWGPLILGHADARVMDAVKGAAGKGTSYGAPTQPETELAKRIVSTVPSIEKLRLVNSGTEATMSAIRLARAFTDRDVIVKVEGCYHGHVDALLVKAGSGATTFGSPTSPGVTTGCTADTALLPFNDLAEAKELFGERSNSIAALILEPVPGNMGIVAPEKGYLQGLHELTESAGALLIFDEVITGFRLGLGGAQKLYGVTPDLTTLGKIIGGGLPVGAYGGRAEIMEMLSPSGSVYQAGTLSGNPVAVAAGLATLEAVSNKGFYKELERKAAKLQSGLADAAAKAGVKIFLSRIGSMFTAFFSDGPVRDYEGALAADTKRYAAFFHAMLERGVYLPPSQFETAFVSAAHTDDDIAKTVAAAAEAFRTVAQS
jgi:glutamate-1-semialdehyde 2,1-aminomutase